tara:strand:+ start:201 stop:689 length:489 start_codon:yes stop_codon:yes gene_type:complete
MAYKYSKGSRMLGDIIDEDDPDTQIDFSANEIALETDGNEMFVVTASGCQIKGGVSYKLTSVTNSESPYTVVMTDHVLLVNSSGGAVTINLPPTNEIPGRELIIKDAGSSAASNNITINCNGSDGMQGQSSRDIFENKGFVQLISNGGSPGQWFWVAKNGFN